MDQQLLQQQAASNQSTVVIPEHLQAGNHDRLYSRRPAALIPLLNLLLLHLLHLFLLQQQTQQQMQLVQEQVQLQQQQVQQNMWINSCSSSRPPRIRARS